MAVVLKTPEKLIIRIEDNESLANAIRRSVSEVPTLAIDEVEIFKNDSALYDEVLAHRLGLVPLKTEKSMTAKTKIDFKLSKIGPCTVHAEDLQGAGDVVFDKMPITILGNDHKLELVATATLGIGTTHAKYVPGLAYYRHLQSVKSSSEIDKIVQSSKSQFKPEKSGSKWICDLNDSEIEEIHALDSDAISDSSEILFTIESYGNMPAEEILKKAIEALDDNLAELAKALK